MIVEVKAINEMTKEKIYGYYLKRDKNARYPAPPSIQVGYVGYSADTGCWYYGTLITDNYGNTHFFPATGDNALVNLPRCGFYYA